MDTIIELLEEIKGSQNANPLDFLEETAPNFSQVVF